ncbi:MAG TPA: sigma-70 family RNA polymerase sigma factor [Verrucomicrobiales bacterium]|nr:sigma-70 family RNA polymerase sigma factor [Verrucomicrobiales bacterium]
MSNSDFPVTGEVCMDSDSDLLHRFASEGDEAAFRELVERHAGMVNGVALRRTQDRAMAEEITQTVFAILVRKAASLGRESLSGWLHHTAFLEARNACRKAARYRDALQQFSEHMTTLHSSENPSWKGIRPHLDEAISRLSAENRHLVVMRFYERKSIREIAAATGKSEEASRKSVQRSLHRLSGFLKKRGVLTTEAALAAVLTAQTLCVKPASAAAIAAGALQTAPSLTAATLSAHTIHAMNVASTVKTSVVVLALCAIPMTMLWRQNTDLQEQLRIARTAPRVAPSPVESSRASSPLGAKKPEVAETTTAAPKASSPANPGGGFPNPFSGDEMLKRAKDDAKKRATSEFKRICANLPDLTDAQKDQIREALETKSSAAVEEMTKMFQAGIVNRMMQDPASLTKEEKAALAKLDPRRNSSFTEDATLKPILTEDQFAQYTKTQEARKVSNAENAASDSLRSVSRSIDLSPDQKDHIFQALAQYELNPVEPAEEVSAPFPGMGARDEAKDRIIRESLTPAQAEIFDQARADEKKSREEWMQRFKPQPAATPPATTPK